MNMLRIQPSVRSIRNETSSRDRFNSITAFMNASVSSLVKRRSSVRISSRYLPRLQIRRSAFDLLLLALRLNRSTSRYRLQEHSQYQLIWRRYPTAILYKNPTGYATWLSFTQPSPKS
jgi:hypothetical protein